METCITFSLLVGIYLIGIFVFTLIYCAGKTPKNDFKEIDAVLSSCFWPVWIVILLFPGTWAVLLIRYMKRKKE